MMNYILKTLTACFYLLLFSCTSKEEKKVASDIPLVDTLATSASPEPLRSVLPIIDTVTIKKLAPNFVLEKDEFDTDGKTFLYPKSRPKYINRNHIFCYFQSADNKPFNFRLKVQYVAEDWLFIQKVIFLIDNTPYEVTPGNVERDNDGGLIWEWFDVQLTDTYFSLIKNLSEAKSVKVKFIGRQYSDVRTLPANQLKSISETYRYYWALGGRFPFNN